MAAQDSVGGLVECRVRDLPAGLGEPFFDSVESLIAHAVFAIPAIKGIEFGDGFAACRMRGSQVNDALEDAGGAHRQQPRRRHQRRHQQRQRARCSGWR